MDDFPRSHSFRSLRVDWLENTLMQQGRQPEASIQGGFFHYLFSLLLSQPGAIFDQFWRRYKLSVEGDQWCFWERATTISFRELSERRSSVMSSLSSEDLVHSIWRMRRNICRGPLHLRPADRVTSAHAWKGCHARKFLLCASKLGLCPPADKNYDFKIVFLWGESKL